MHVQMELSLVLGILLAPTVWLGHFVSMTYPLYAELAPTQQQELQAVAYALLAPSLPPARAHAATALLALEHLLGQVRVFNCSAAPAPSLRRPPRRAPNAQRAATVPQQASLSRRNAQPALSLGRMLQSALHAQQALSLGRMLLSALHAQPAHTVPQQASLNRHNARRAATVPQQASLNRHSARRAAAVHQQASLNRHNAQPALSLGWVLPSALHASAAITLQQGLQFAQYARRPQLRMMELPTTRRASAPPVPWATSPLPPLRPV
jgi:hypothetical protein